MCYSAQASLVALILGLIGQILLFSRGDLQSKSFALALTSVTAIQAYEYVLWNNPCSDESPNTTNRDVSRLTMLTILAQPIIIYLAATYANPKSTDVRTALLVGALGYIVLAVVESWKQWESVTCSAPAGFTSSGNTCTATSCGLEWQFINTIPAGVWAYYLLVILASVYIGIRNRGSANVVALFILSAYALSGGLHGQQRSVASHWCFYAVLLPWIMYVLPTTISK
jgi:hypothetical protein